jgi:hypothetical protein
LRRGPRRRREEERVTDPGERPSAIGRALLGCVGVVVVIALGAGAVGIALGAHRRLASFGGDEEEEVDPDQPPPPPGQVDPGDPIAGDPIAGDPNPPPTQSTVADMQRRYRPGPHVRVDSMVPSGRLLPATFSGQVIAGRTVDNPWIVPGAQLVPTSFPNPTAGGPNVSHDPNEAIGTPLTVVARTPARALVRARDASGGTNVVVYLIEFIGYQGHFRLPATVPTELGAVQAGGSDGATIHFAIQSPIRPDRTPVAAGQTFPVTMRISAVDDQNRVSSSITRELSVVAVGAGDVEVTLTMDQATDLDLYVVDPTGVTIYYGNTDAMSGGHLDLDANAACGSNMGVNNEHIFWPQGRSPAGTYRVNVAHWRNCVGGPVSYRVTVRACGETVVLSGRFQGSGQSGMCSTATPADVGWCQEVVTFDVPPCAP